MDNIEETSVDSINYSQIDNDDNNPTRKNLVIPILVISL
jgi:hypothetical protein